MVFTTKHHDGFCMFDSAYTDYKITNTPYGKDIVAQLAKACETMACRWASTTRHPTCTIRGSATPPSWQGNWNGEPQRPEWPTYLAYLRLQLAELLTRYGPVALIWFDGLNHQEKYDGAEVLRMIHGFQPATLVNDRMGVDGDYETAGAVHSHGYSTRGIVLTGVDPEVSKRLKNSVRVRRTFAFGRPA